MSNMVVQTNIRSLNAHRNMKNTGAEQRRASNRLASGYRINSAADDAAGLAISESMRSQIRGLDQASRNAQDGQALINTAEGGMQEIQNMLQRIRELVVQAANDTNVEHNRAQIQLEIDNLLDEINGMSERVEFNSRQLLTGNFSNVAIATYAERVGQRDNSEWLTSSQRRDEVDAFLQGSFTEITNHGIDIEADVFQDWATFVAAANLADAGVPDPTLRFEVVRLTDDGSPVDGAGRVNIFVDIGGQSFRIAANVDVNQNAGIHGLLPDEAEVEAAVQEWLTSMTTPERAGESHAVMTALGFVDGGVHDVRLNGDWSTRDSGDSLWFQIGANSTQSITVNIADMSAQNIFGNNADGQGQMGQRTLRALQSIGDYLSNRASDISDVINGIQRAVDFVSDQRADLGAVSNRLEFTSRSLDISSENLSDAESRVRNTDMAREMMRFTMSNVLQQAAVSMLSQANQLPNNLLQLLR